VIEISLQQLVFAPGVSDAFAWALNEVAGNVLDYAEAPGWIEAVTHRDRVVFCVCDAGVGVPTTIRRVFGSIQSDKDALAISVRAGIKKSPRGQGNGLAGCLAIARESEGVFHLASGEASLYFDSHTGQRLKNYSHSFAGTCVNMQLPTDASISIEKALWGHRLAMTATEQIYSNDKGELALRLRDLASNFGNRATGERIRNLILNIVAQNQGKRVRVMLQDVPVMSSSFADEVFGKLVTDLGIVDFNSRIALEGANGLCKHLIDAVVRQRLAQTYFENERRDDAR
jgi:hypothetical protein